VFPHNKNEIRTYTEQESGYVAMELKQMNLRQKIGQMVMVGFNGKEPSLDVEELLRSSQVGGIIYFRRNLQEPSQVRRMSQRLQQMAAENGGIPLLISIDQEGGMVARIEEGVALMPGNMSIGATRDVQAAYEAAKWSAGDLLALGINMNFAPCVDVNNNAGNPVIGVRSFAEDAELTGDMGASAVAGYQEAGVAATAKHFPGHGDTANDSHTDLPLIPHDRERLERLELVPFRKAIAAGVDAIMTAHVLFPALEAERLPATLSKNVITGLLRGDLGYEGVIVTDCLEMNAIASYYGVAEGAVLAIEAGADMVLVSHTIEHQVQVLGALVEAVQSGRISEERIDASVARILALKDRRAAGREEALLPAEEQMERQERANRWAEQCFSRSITLVKDNGVLPLSKDKQVLVVWPEVRVGTEVDEIIPQTETLGYWLERQAYTIHEKRIGVQPSSEELDNVLQAAKYCEQIVVVTYNADVSLGQTELVRKLAETGKSLIVAAVRNPFDLNAFPQVNAYVACYENRPLAMKALARIITGEAEPTGKLPVTINETYRFGWSFTELDC
jgi:beta-N-acetylhexosaminidase